MIKSLISKTLNNDIDIVVASCDSYSDVWPHFFENFFKKWEDCPFDIHLISNKKIYNHEKVKNINVGIDKSWSENLKKGLKSIKKEYIILFIDDLIINQKICSNYLKKILSWVEIKSPNYVRLHTSNKPKKYDELLGVIHSEDPYRSSTMPSIWKKSVLRELLKDGESAWDFEIVGSRRARKFNKFYSVNKNLIFLDNAIIKGRWQKSIVDKLNIEHAERPIMTSFEQLVYNMKVLRSKLFNLLPVEIRVALKN